jgi:hypothetical protein
MRFILSGASLPLFIADPAAVAYFAGKSPFIPVAYAAKAPVSWGAVPYQDFTAYADLLAAIENGKINPAAQAIMYDNEQWSFTPTSEQADPAKYIQLFGQAVHSLGLLFMSVPGISLAAKPADNGQPWNPATWADVYDIQVQGSEEGPLFAQRVGAAVHLARAANPNCLVTAGITTYPPGGPRPTAQQIADAVHSVEGIVDGFWFNVPTMSPQVPNCPDMTPNEPLAMQALALI